MSASTKFEPVSLAANDLHLAFGSNAVLRGVDIDVPASATHTKPVGLNAMPHAFTRLGSMWSACSTADRC